jgi:putative transposase
MVTPQSKREAVAYVLEAHRVTERRACAVMSVERSLIRYSSVKPKDTDLRARLKAIALERRRFGYRRLAIFLRREGFACNIKKIYRIYREENLMVKRRKGRKKAIGTRHQLQIPYMINQIWSLDFISDALVNGRRFRVMGVMDQCSRECLTLTVDTSIGGERVVRELDLLVDERGKPDCIVSDNGTEFTSKAVLQWAENNGIFWHYIQPGKPQQNGFTESLNDKIRNECLNENWFDNLREAQKIIEDWRHDYNHVRPHSSLNYETPAEFASKKGGQKIKQNSSQAAVCARLLTVAQPSTCENSELCV